MNAVCMLYCDCIALRDLIHWQSRHAFGPESLNSITFRDNFFGRLTPYEGDVESEARWEADLLSLVSQGELAVGRDMMRVINPST